ncbi:MAG: PDZ domain-containing protein, partial [Myxococcota bacterium]
EELPLSMVLGIARQKLGIELTYSERQAAFEITNLEPHSAAEKLGLRRGDFLLAINGVQLNSSEDLRRAVARLRALQRALIVVQRGAAQGHLALPLL